MDTEQIRHKCHAFYKYIQNTNITLVLADELLSWARVVDRDKRKIQQALLAVADTKPHGRDPAILFTSLDRVVVSITHLRASEQEYYWHVEKLVRQIQKEREGAGKAFSELLDMILKYKAPTTAQTQTDASTEAGGSKDNVRARVAKIANVKLHIPQELPGNLDIGWEKQVEWLSRLREEVKELRAENQAVEERLSALTDEVKKLNITTKGEYSE